MRLFKKPSQKEDDQKVDSIMKPASKVNFFNWFAKLTKSKLKPAAITAAAATDEPRHKETQTLALSEIEFVPRTEITASRQVLDNIELVLHGESSRSVGGGETSTADPSTNTKQKRGCKNKFCCGIVSRSQSHLESADDGDDDESVKSSPNKGKTASRRTSSSDDSKKFYIFHPPAVDYARLEVPDSSFPGMIDSLSLPMINRNDLYELTREVTQPNYEVISSIEHNLDPRKYNIVNCMAFNAKYKHEHDPPGSGCRPEWKFEDYNDDKKNTPADRDTRAIKEFYRLNEVCDILLHFHDVMVEEATHSIEGFQDGISDLFSWLVYRGKEIKEKKHNSTLTWMRTVTRKLKYKVCSKY